MKLSISNIACIQEQDDQLYRLMQKYDFKGLEIAPTRIFSDDPYEDLQRSRAWSYRLNKEYGFKVSSMQSILYGRNEKIFNSPEERQALVEYTKKAIDFAKSIGCHNLVFGCPRNRNIYSDNDKKIGETFFCILGKYALEHNTVIGMEANPTIYNTNYINTTEEAIELVKQVNSEGFRLNLDVGTIIANNEDINILVDNIDLINHVHISEPELKCIKKRNIHSELKELLVQGKYEGYISIEMGKTNDMNDIERVMCYVRSIFYDV